jgi:hypothetical protein
MINEIFESFVFCLGDTVWAMLVLGGVLVLTFSLIYLIID